MSTENNGVSYKNLNDLPIMEETNDNTYALVADGDSMKRVPGSMLGGGGIKTAIIKDNYYDIVLNGGAPDTNDVQVYTCLNLSFEEAYATIKSGNPLAVRLMTTNSSDGTAFYALCEEAKVAFDNNFAADEVIVMSDRLTLLWGSTGIEQMS